MTPRRVALAALVALVAAGCSDPIRPDADPAPTTQPSLTATPGGTPSVAPPSDPPAGAPRPNVLVIETDDMRADELRWMPRTRSLIAGRGLTFANSFSPDPLCCPARASFLTGQYSHNHQVLSHEEPYGFGAFDDADTLATRLTGEGYRTALVGKYLNGYGVQPAYATGADSETYVPPGWTQWWAGNDRVRPLGDPLYGGTYSYFSLTSNVNGALRSWPGRYSTDVTAEQTRALVARFGSAPQERPWFVW
ncbi:MAG: sulfatase-like hydrolase/transferase, partial [Nocardioides sp.]